MGENERMYNHVHLSYRHNEPEFNIVSKLMKTGANQTIAMLVKIQSLSQRNSKIMKVCLTKEDKELRLSTFGTMSSGAEMRTSLFISIQQ